MDLYACNPLDLAYRFQDVRPGRTTRTVHREAADPSIVRFRNRYYLFASMSRGFWHSIDLVHWVYQPTDKLPALDYAPDARVIEGELIICASKATKPCPMYRSRNPLDDDFEQVHPGEFAFWDPNLFADDDGSVHLYWGCSNTTPLHAVELDPTALKTCADSVDLFGGDPAIHGWEQPGEDYQAPATAAGGLLAKFKRRPSADGPYIEGAWMTKHDGRYYLQYAAPGTEFNTYADGYYTATAPQGPFEYSTNSPFSAKPGGFITGAGHGSTLQDVYGNWWHAATMRISVHHSFERRIGLFPAGFDDDGVLFCNQNFADYPMVVPDRKFDPWTESFAGWMLMSYRAKASASSYMPGHLPAMAVNEDVRTWWVADSAEKGQWLQLDFGTSGVVHAIQVNLAEHDLAGIVAKRTDGQMALGSYRAIDPDDHATELKIELSDDGVSWLTVADTTGAGKDQPHGFFVLPDAMLARYIRVTAGDLPFGGHFAVSGLRVFGLGAGRPPAATDPVATRVDERTAHIEWPGLPRADGYNIRYGTDPAKLYHSWLVYDQYSLDLRSLNAGADYWVAVDSFNRNGITSGDVIQIK